MDIRLGILLDNNVIDRECYEVSMSIHEKIMKPRRLSELDAYQVVMTHIAMALHRIKNDDVVGAMDEQILLEITGHDNYASVKSLGDEILDLIPIEMPESEAHYIQLHLLNLLNEERRGL